MEMLFAAISFTYSFPITEFRSRDDAVPLLPVNTPAPPSLPESSSFAVATGSPGARTGGNWMWSSLLMLAALPMSWLEKVSQIRGKGGWRVGRGNTVDKDKSKTTPRKLNVTSQPHASDRVAGAGAGESRADSRDVELVPLLADDDSSEEHDADVDEEAYSGDSDRDFQHKTPMKSSASHALRGVSSEGGSHWDLQEDLFCAEQSIDTGV